MYWVIVDFNDRLHNDDSVRDDCYDDWVVDRFDKESDREKVKEGDTVVLFDPWEGSDCACLAKVFKITETGLVYYTPNWDTTFYWNFREYAQLDQSLFEDVLPEASVEILSDPFWLEKIDRAFRQAEAGETVPWDEYQKTLLEESEQ